MGMAKGPKKKPLTFGEKFRNARKAGKANFMHNGKKFSTKTKEEVSKKGTRKTVRGMKKAIRKRSDLSKSGRMARRKVRKAARKVRRTNRALRK